MSTYSDAVLADSPAGYWRFGEKEGTVAADATGGGRPGVYENEPTLGADGALASDVDTSITLNTIGTTQKQHVSVADAAAFDFGAVFTYEAWFWRDGFGLTDCVIDKGEGGPILRFDGEDHLLLRRNGVADIVRSTITITDDFWHHVYAGSDGTTAILYIDGVDRTGTVTFQACASTAIAFGFGASDAGLASYYRGGLDEIAVYSTAPDPAVALAHHEIGNNSVPPENLDPPVLSGTPDLGEDLACSEGEWAGEVSEVQFAWQINAGAGWVALPEAHEPLYTVQRRDDDRSLRCLVTAVGPGGSTALVTDPLDVVVVRARAGGIVAPAPRWVKSHGLVVPKPAMIFQGNQKADYFLQSAPGAITEVADPLGGPQTVFKMAVDNADVSPITPSADPRAQLAGPLLHRFPSEILYSFLDGSELWVRVGFLLPDDFPSIPEWMQLVQLFGPPFAIVAPWAIKVQEDVMLYQRNETYGFDEPWIAAAVPRGEWTDVLLRVKMGADGWVEMWINGEPITFFDPATSYNPHGAPTGRRLEMETVDEGNNGPQGNAIWLQNYRKVDTVPGVVTIYHRPLVVKAA